MRIADLYSNVASDPNVAASLRGKPGTSDASGPQNDQAAQQSAVKVTVSAKARELALAHSAGDVDEAKVAKLRDAIEAGSLKMDSEKIAERVVDGD